MDSMSRTITDDFLTCTICFGTYTEPQTLPCLHSFCRQCIANFIQRSYSKSPYHCPVCRESFSGQQSLKANFVLQNMIDLIKKFLDSSKSCSFCKLMDKNHIAVSQCISCLDYLCEQCTKGHTYTRQTIDHKVKPLNEIMQGKYDNEIRLVQKIRCPQHNDEILRYYCSMCSLAVCRDCIIFEHKSHDCPPISEARKQKENEISEVMKPLKKKLEALQENALITAVRMKELTDRESLIRKQIEKTCSEAVNNIREKQKKMECQLEARLKPGRERLQHVMDTSSKVCKNIEEAIIFSEKILKTGNDIEVLSLVDEIFQRLAKLSDENTTEYSQCPAVDFPDFQIKWNEPSFSFTCVNKTDSISTNQKTGHEERNRTISSESNERKSVFSSPSNLSRSLSRSVPNLSRFGKGQMVYELNLLDSLDLTEGDDKYKPVYSSVAWIDGENIVVVDKENKKIKLLNLHNRTVKSIALKKCLGSNRV